MVAIPGGEPLIHKEIGEIVKGIVARKKFVSLCTNALLLEKKLDLFEPSPYPVLLGASRRHQGASRQVGVHGRRLRARRLGHQGRQGQGLRRQRQCHHLRRPSGRGHRGVPRSHCRSSASASSISPGYAYERAPDQEHFLNRRKTKELFRKVFALGKGKKWKFAALRPVPRFPGRQPGTSTARPGACRPATSSAGRSPATCWARATPRRFTELMETTDWDTYGTGAYEKCAELHGPLRL